MPAPLLIGVSARIHHPVGAARNLGGVYTKTLHYLEQSVAHWVISANVLVFMIPAIESEGLIQRSDMRLYHYSDALDGLVMQGGADIAPETYGRVLSSTAESCTFGSTSVAPLAVTIADTLLPELLPISRSSLIARSVTGDGFVGGELTESTRMLSKAIPSVVIG